MQQNVSPGQALALVLENTRATGAEEVPTEEALGRTLARDVVAAFDLPPFDPSAMDGYALRAADLRHASPQTPARLLCTRTLAAGAHALADEDVGPGECVRIMTGAPVPRGADAVVMREEASVEADRGEAERGRESIIFRAPCEEGQNIRRRGEDIRAGEIAVEAGTRLRAAEIGLVAACGEATVSVSRRPRVALVVTGDELLSPGQERGEGQIYDSNGYTLRALVEECGARVTFFARTGDEPEAFARGLREAARGCDAVVTSGGVSAGDFDPVRDVLPTLARAHFWKVAIKPAKPVMFATMGGNGGGEPQPVPVFALPGNPVSVAVAFELFVRPALLQMQGRKQTQRVRLLARVEGSGRSPGDKQEYVRAQVASDGSGGWVARVSGSQSSGRLSSLARANALLVVPVGVASYQSGQEFEAIMTDWPES